MLIWGKIIHSAGPCSSLIFCHGILQKSIDTHVNMREQFVELKHMHESSESSKMMKNGQTVKPAVAINSIISVILP